MSDEGFDLRAHLGETVSLRGIAWTGAAGAHVEVAAGEPVYLHGIRRWESDLEGRPVEVSGILRWRGSAQSDATLDDVDTGQFILEEPSWTSTP